VSQGGVPIPNAIARTAADMLGERLSVLDFGAVGDGVTDDTAAIQKALFSLIGYTGTITYKGVVANSGVLPSSPAANDAYVSSYDGKLYVYTSGWNAISLKTGFGGTVSIPDTLRCLINGNLVIPQGCTLQGPHTFTGSPGSNANTPYASMGGALLVNGASTVAIMSSGSISGLLIRNAGVSLPASSVASFSGTAITIVGDDVLVEKCAILGFNMAVICSNPFPGIGGVPPIGSRPRLSYLNLDNINGVFIQNSYDIPYVENCHAWPFATIAGGGPLQRSGIAYQLQDTADWAKLTNCFSYGYAKGLQLYGQASGTNNVTVMNCGFDNVPGSSSASHGIYIAGLAQGTRIVGCSMAAQVTSGVYVGLTVPQEVVISDTDVIGPTQHGVLVAYGNAIVTNCGFNNVSNGISTDSGNSSSSITIEDNSFIGVGKTVNLATTNPMVIYGDTNYTDALDFPFGSAGSGVWGSVQQRNVASSVLTLNQMGSTFSVASGDGSYMGALKYGWPGRIVTLIFSASVGIYSSISSNQIAIKLAGPSYVFSMVFNQYDTLTLRHDGNQWYEIGRAKA
jgi:hypothetical protein